jgi:hypothetical protein
VTELDEVSDRMKELAADPLRRGRLQSAQIAKDNAIVAVIRSELPAVDYLRGRYAASVYQALHEKPPVPLDTDLSAAAPWLAWEAALMRGDVDAPSPGL